MDILSEIEALEFKEAFDEFDKDRSGSISTKELLFVMRSIGQNPTEDEIQDLIMESDLNGDGTIDFKEFLAMMKRKSAETDQTEDLKEAFRIFDKNKNGFIEVKELKNVTTMLGQKLTDDEFEEFWKEADVNHDGKLDYNEFVKAMANI